MHYREGMHVFLTLNAKLLGFEYVKDIYNNDDGFY
jgi:hypothetical protein